MTRTLISSVLLFVSIQSFAQNSRFTYSGEPFNDPEWGKSYKTSEDDRRVLSKAHGLIKQVVKKLEDEPGDYTLSVTTDMSQVFDTTKPAGPNCRTCYYSMSPATGAYFYYIYDLKLELVEDSKTFVKKAKRDDSLNAILLKESTAKRNANNNDAQVQADMSEYEKEVQKMAASGKIDEAKLAELERKANAVNKKADVNANAQSMDKDYQRILMMPSYASLIKLRVITNEPVTASEKRIYTGMNNNADYYYKELHLPGCSFACIYFDKHQKASNLPYSENYQLVAYAGNNYENTASMPKTWLKPFCIKLTANGNLEQLNELISKIDFAKMAEVIR